MSSDTEVDCEYRAESATYIPKPGEIVVRVCADNGLALCIVVTEHDGSEENLREMNAALRSTANDTFTSMSTKKSNTYYRTEENEVGVVSADGKHIAPLDSEEGRYWLRNMRNGQLDGATSPWTSSTSGAKSRPPNHRRPLTNDSQNPPIGLFNLPDRKIALHNKVDLMRNPDHEDLISELELHRIRQIWITERQDWEDSLPDIYEDVMGESLDWREEDISKPGGVEADVLREVAEEHDVPEEMMRKLIDAEWQHHGMRRRATIHKDIESIMSEDWRSREEVLEEAKRKRLQHEAAQEEADREETDQEETVAA